MPPPYIIRLGETIPEPAEIENHIQLETDKPQPPFVDPHVSHGEGMSHSITFTTFAEVAAQRVSALLIELALDYEKVGVLNPGGSINASSTRSPLLDGQQFRAAPQAYRPAASPGEETSDCTSSEAAESSAAEDEEERPHESSPPWANSRAPSPPLRSIREQASGRAEQMRSCGSTGQGSSSAGGRGAHITQTNSRRSARARQHDLPMARRGTASSTQDTLNDSPSPYTSVDPWTQGRLPEWITKSLQRRNLSHAPTQSRAKDLLVRLESWLPWAVPSDHSDVEPVLQRLHKSRSKALRMRRRRMMEHAWALLSFLNAFFVCWELQYFVTREELPGHVVYLSAAFTAAFTVELLVRLFVDDFRMKVFFCGNDGFWNVLDVLIISWMWYDVGVRLLMTDAPSWVLWDVSAVRIIRFMRLLGTVSARMEFLREIRVLARVLRVALRSLVWILVFSSCFMYFCSIYLASGAHRLCHTGDGEVLEGRDLQLLCQHFGTLGLTFSSIFQATFGGLLWGDLIDIMAVAPMRYQITLVVSVIFNVIILANLTTGVLVDVHADGKHHDIEYKMAEEERNARLFVHAMQDVFYEIDTNRSGALSREELELALDDSKMCALLRCHNLEVHDAHLLFDLLDTDHSNSIDVEHFISGCIKMKGQAQAIDIVRMQMQMTEMKSQLKSLQGGAPLQANSGILHIPESSQDLLSRQSAAGDRQSESFEHVSAQSAHSRQVTPKEEPAAGVVGGRESQMRLLAGQCAALASVAPTLTGMHIPRTEERAMFLHDLRKLHHHIQLRAPVWVDERSGEVMKPQKLNMYNVAYNWICPLTLPDGVVLSGLNADAITDLSPGTFIFQALKPDSFTYRAAGQVQWVTSDGRVKVKVIRGRFVAGGSDDEHHADIMCEGCSLGVPHLVETPIALSYKELVSREAKTPDWYCCHWWGEPFFSFLACMEAHCKLHSGALQMTYWICAFANSQHDLGVELSDDPGTSSFKRAMQSSKGTLLVLDDKAVPFRRIWCDYELYITLLTHKSLDIASHTKREGSSKRRPQILANLPGESAFSKTKREEKFPIGLLAKGMTVRLEEGDASVAMDKERILKAMRKEVQKTSSMRSALVVDDLDWVNQALNSHFAWAAWPQALRKGIVRSFHKSAENHLGIDLPRITTCEIARLELSLSLAHFEEVDDAAIADIMRGLPPKLVELSLSFEGCNRLSDRALQHVARGLRRSTELQRLQLDFLGCRRISDVGLEDLAGSLPQSLRRLRLDFAKCGLLGFAGIAGLAQSVPTGVKEFTATFQGTVVNENFYSVEDMRSSLRGVLSDPPRSISLGAGMGA